jgi:hypothetical protein
MLKLGKIGDPRSKRALRRELANREAEVAALKKPKLGDFILGLLGLAALLAALGTGIGWGIAWGGAVFGSPTKPDAEVPLAVAPPRTQPGALAAEGPPFQLAVEPKFDQPASTPANNTDEDVKRTAPVEEAEDEPRSDNTVAPKKSARPPKPPPTNIAKYLPWLR